MSRFRDTSHSVFSEFSGLDTIPDDTWVDQMQKGKYIIVSKILGAGLTQMVSPDDIVTMIRRRINNLGYNMDIQIRPIKGEQDFFVMKVQNKQD